MPDDRYSLGDLARLADVTPRTIRYYIAQGLLPSPEAAGPATRYGEGHLARLRLIRRLQRDHLPLAEIRLRLERLGDDEILASVRALEAASAEPSQEPGDALAFVRSLMRQSGIRPTPPVEAGPAGPGGVRLSRLAVSDSLERAYAEAPPMAAPSNAPAPAAPMPAGSPRPGPGRSTWERVVITPDVELHIRRPLDRQANKRVDQLERIARELFDDR